MPTFFVDGETVREFRDWARADGYAKPGSSLLTVMRNYARRHGVAVGVRACDTVIQFELVGGKLRQRTYQPGEAKITWPGKVDDALVAGLGL